MSTPPSTVPIEILIVEDSPADARLTIEALRDARILNNIHVATDGQQALEFLNRKGSHADAPRPDFILLDLEMPKVDGYEVLDAIKTTEALKDIPVIILTSSQKQEDIARAYKHHASCYIRKPVDPDEYFLAIRALKTFWFDVVSLPDGDKAKTTGTSS
jgi:chemotaxis family two-component system response regulator Rcp1